MANAVDNFEVPEGDDFEISEAEIKTIEGELNELLNPTNGDDKEESCLSLSAQVLEEQPDVIQIIESVAKITWTEAKGKFFGTGFLAKITLGVEDRLGFFTAGHNLYDTGSKQLVNASSVQLRFKDIRKQTKKVALSKFLGQKHVLIVAYKTCKIIIRNGQESTQPCRKGLDFGAVIFTAPVNSAARFLNRLGLSYLQVASPGACSSAPNMPVQLVGFPQYIENSPMRILPGNELVVPPGNIPDHCYDMETETGASGGSVLDKGGRVIAVHIRGQNITKGDEGNWGLGFDLIREELQLCLNISSLASQSQPGTSDPHKTQGMPALTKFLKNMKLDKYIPVFEADDIDMEVLENCETEELGQMLNDLGVTLGHKKKIIKALQHETREKKEQMKKEQEREKDQLENSEIDSEMTEGEELNLTMNMSLKEDTITDEKKMNLAMATSSEESMPKGKFLALGNFLKNMKLEQYISKFEAEDIDLEVLEKCEHEELGQVLKDVGVTLGNKIKITQALHHEKRPYRLEVKERNSGFPLATKEQEDENDNLHQVLFDIDGARVHFAKTGISPIDPTHEELHEIVAIANTVDE